MSVHIGNPVSVHRGKDTASVCGLKHNNYDATLRNATQRDASSPRPASRCVALRLESGLPTGLCIVACT